LTGTILCMLRKIMGIFIKTILYLIILGIIVFALPRLITSFTSINKIKTIANVANEKVAIVFGAGLLRDGTPSPVLKDRVSMAAQLYFAGKIQKILMSGDNRFVDYNEPASMQAFALELGVPEEVIVLDYAGRRTYDTCYRAKHIFGIDQAILVTQKYHLPRALFTCNGIGLKSIGVIADLRTYHPKSLSFWNFRELPATVVALWQVWVSHPLPVMGDPEPIVFD
jgi:SanA protein